MTPGFGPRSTLEEVDGEDVDNLRWALKRMKFKFTSYVEGHFSQLRTSLFEIGPARYAASLSGHKDAHFDGGKSGAIFFFSKDKRYIIKEVTTSELQTLLSILPNYIEYMTQNPESLLPRIMQLCSIRMYRRTMNFMVPSPLNKCMFRVCNI